MIEEIKRKLFHLLGFIYVLGLAMLRRPHFLGVVCFLWIVISVLEILRLKSHTVQQWFQHVGGGLFRDHEFHHFSGVWWMVLGVISCGILLEPFRLAVTPLLYLLLGDSAASLVGKSIKTIHWPGLQKSVGGSLACFIVCLLIGWATLYSTFGIGPVFWGALVATLLEVGFIPLNDNLLIPLGSALFLRIWI